MVLFSYFNKISYTVALTKALFGHLCKTSLIQGYNIPTDNFVTFFWPHQICCRYTDPYDPVWQFKCTNAYRQSNYSMNKYVLLLI